MAITFTTLQANILDTIQDRSFSGASVYKMLNKAMDYISNQVSLPDLRVSSSITCTSASAYTSLPSNYQREILRAYSKTAKKVITIRSSRAEMLNYDEYDSSAKTGISSMVVEGGKIYYDPLPVSSETVEIFYHKQPEQFSTSSSSVTCIPSHIASPLLESYVCWKLSSKYEDGVEQNKVNTAHHEREFNQELSNLKYWAKPDGRGFSSFKG